MEGEHLLTGWLFSVVQCTVNCGNANNSEGQWDGSWPAWMIHLRGLCLKPMSHQGTLQLLHELRE